MIAYYIKCFITFFLNGTSTFPRKPIKPDKYYLKEIWIEGMYNMDYPPYLVLRRRMYGIFYKTIIDFGLLTSLEECKSKYKIANKYLHLLNLRYNYKKEQYGNKH